MDIQIFYFSGTGNSAWVSQTLKNTLEEMGHQCTALSCETVATKQVNIKEMLGVVFPIYASFAPPIFKSFIDQLPPGNNTPCFVIATAGFAAGDIALYVSKQLERKGYAPFLADAILMGNNLHLPLISPLPVTTGDTLKQKLDVALLQIELLTQDIEQKILHIRGNAFGDKALGIGQRTFYKLFETLVFKQFHADETCINCGWCVNNCPVQAIEAGENHPTFTKACIHCMRCYSFCPLESIQYTEKTKNKNKYRRYTGPEGLKGKTTFK